MRERSLLLLSDYHYRIPAPGAGKTSPHVIIGFWSSFSLVDQKIATRFFGQSQSASMQNKCYSNLIYCFFFKKKTYNALNRIMIYRVSLRTLYFLFESLRYGRKPEKIM